MILLGIGSATFALNAQGERFGVALTPALVEAGSPVLIHVDAPSTAKVDGVWLGNELEFFAARDGHGWYALAGVDVDAAAGPSTLKIGLKLPGGETRDLSRVVEIHEAHYRTGSLTVAPKFVEPDAEAMKRIEAEAQIKAKVFAASAPDPLWQGNFRKPVTAGATDSFGTRRMFNGKLASIHKGNGFSGEGGNAGAGGEQRRGGAGAGALLRGKLRGDRSRAGTVYVVDALEPDRRARGAACGDWNSAGVERGDGTRNGPASALGGALAWRVPRSGKDAATGLERGTLVRDGFFFNFLLRREGRSEAGGFLLAQSFIGAIDEPTHIPAVNELVGRFTGSVVATREHARLEVEADATEGVDNLERIFLGERQVVVGIDEKDFLAGSAGLFADDLWVVVAGADGGPQVADAVLRKASFFKRLFDVAGALAGPGDVTKSG